MSAAVRAPRRLRELTEVAWIRSVHDAGTAFFIGAPGNHRGVVGHGFEDWTLSDFELSRHSWRIAQNDSGEDAGEHDY
jgi:hypothetical protein